MKSISGKEKTKRDRQYRHKIQELTLLLYKQSGATSQQVFANKLQVHRSRIYRWLSGNASLETPSLRILAKAINCKMEDLTHYLNSQISLGDFLVLLSPVKQSLSDSNVSVADILKQLPLLSISELDAIAQSINSLATNYHNNTSGKLVHFPGYGNLIASEIQSRGLGLNDAGLKNIADLASLDISRLRRIWYGFIPSEVDLIGLSTALRKPNGELWTIEELLNLSSVGVFADAAPFSWEITEV